MEDNIKKKEKLVSIQRIILLGLCLLLIFTISGCNSTTIKFNQNIWINAKDDESYNIRKKMVHDLVNGKMLVGKSKQDVVKLLGPPEEFANVESNTLYYTIEIKYGWDIDPIMTEYLIVSFNSKDIVSNVCRKTIK